MLKQTKSSDSILDTYRLHLTKEDNRSRGRNRESWQEHMCVAGPSDTHCHKPGISLTRVTPQPASAECITYQTSYQDSASWFMWLKGQIYTEDSDAHHGVWHIPAVISWFFILFTLCKWCSLIVIFCLLLVCRSVIDFFRVSLLPPSNLA